MQQDNTGGAVYHLPVFFCERHFIDRQPVFSRKITKTGKINKF